MNNPFDLAGQAALVTGSTRGIGAAIASALSSAGASVVRHGLAHGETFAEPVIGGDLREANAPATLVDDAFAANPNLNLLVANAGSFYDKPLLEMTPELFDQTMALNVRANFLVCQAFAKKLIANNRRGAIVLTISTNGFQAEEGSVAYDTSKGALVMMTKTLALNLADHGIRVNGIAPGLILTPLSAGINADGSSKSHYLKKIPLRRLGKPDDCTGAVIFLCSSASEYITGEIITIDGGLTICQIGRQ